MPKMLKSMDMFAADLPKFNMRGEESVKTNIGGCCSIIIIYVSLMYAAHKFNHLVNKHSPQVLSYEVADAFGEDDRLDTSQSDFMLAVALEDFNTGEIKKDPRYVKWYAEYLDNDMGVKTKTEVPMHECSEEDYAKFHTPNDAALERLERIKENGGMMCIDWKRDSVVFSGNENSASYRAMDIMIVPCGMRETIIGGTEDRVPEDCNYDRDAFMKYLGSIQMLMYFNKGQFELGEFGDESVSYSSDIKVVQAASDRPSWIWTKLVQNLLADETNFIQLGNADEVEFVTLDFESPRPSSMTVWPDQFDGSVDLYYKVTSAFVEMWPH